MLLERMTQVGEGARRAEGRRGLERMEEEMMRRDWETQWLARVRGVGLLKEEGSLLRWMLASPHLLYYQTKCCDNYL